MSAEPDEMSAYEIEASSGGRDGLERLNDLLEAVSQRMAFIAVAAVLVIAFTNVADVILRNLFATSLYGLSEINALLVAIAVSTCLPYGMARGAPLQIDLLSGRLNRVYQSWFLVFSAGCMCLFLALAGWRIGMNAEHIGATNQTTLMTDIPKAPFFWCVAIAVSFSAVMQLSVFVRNIRVALSETARAGWPKLELAVGIALAAVLLYGALALAGVVSAQFAYSLAPRDPLLLSGLAFLLMWVAILLTVPLGAAMGLTGIIGTATVLNIPISMEILGSETTGFITRDALSVLPLFLLMGAFATVAGIGSDLYRVANALLGHVRGGLAHASILACAGFGTLTGSSIATQMSVGKIALKEMQERGYSDELAAGSIAAGGTLGQLIPPSSALILYAVMTEQSVGQLFIGAVIPGILATLLYMATVTFWIVLFPNSASKGARASLREIASVSKSAWSVLLLLGVVLGGIYFGLFTELEAGSVGAAGAFLMALARGKLNRATFWQTMGETTMTLAMMYSLIFGVVMLSFFFGIAHLPQTFVAWVNSFDLTPLGVILCLVMAYLVLGTAMDAFAMMVITIPIFVPLVASLGYDPVWWGLMTLICMEAGQISPPFGINIFVISSLDARIPIGKVYKGCWPFFASTIMKIALLIAFPALVTWLPSTM